jgi:acetyl-CoA acetyltransferase
LSRRPPRRPLEHQARERLIDTFIIGGRLYAFRQAPNKSFKQLTREAFEAVINDASLDDGNAIENIYFANVKMDAFEQPNIRGQVCFMDLVHCPDGCSQAPARSAQRRRAAGQGARPQGYEVGSP